MEHSHTHRPGSGRSRSTDACQDRRIVGAVVAARIASRDGIPGSCCTCCVTKDHWEPSACRSRVPLDRLPPTPRHCQAWLIWCRERVDWIVEGALLSSAMIRFCLYASDGRTRVRRRPDGHHFPECIRPRHTGPTSDFIMWGPSFIYNSRLHFVFLQSKVGSARYITQVVNHVLQLFLQLKMMCFFIRTAYVHLRALRGVQLPWPARIPDLSPIEHVWDMMKRELILSPESATTIAELRQRMQDAWDNLSQEDIRHLYDSLHVRIHACVAARGGYIVY